MCADTNAFPCNDCIFLNVFFLNVFFLNVFFLNVFFLNVFFFLTIIFYLVKAKPIRYVIELHI